MSFEVAISPAGRLAVESAPEIVPHLEERAERRIIEAVCGW